MLAGEFAALTDVFGEDAARKDVVATLLSRITVLQQAAAASEATRRKLHDELVTLRGNVRAGPRVELQWRSCGWRGVARSGGACGGRAACAFADPRLLPRAAAPHAGAQVLGRPEQPQHQRGRPGARLWL